MAAWRERLKTGDIGPILYVAVTRADISNKYLEEIYGDVHMLGHANAREVLRARKRSCSANGGECEAGPTPQAAEAAK